MELEGSISFMGSVVHTNLPKIFPKEGELYDRILKLVFEYEGELSFYQAIGALDDVKRALYLGVEDEQ